MNEKIRWLCRTAVMTAVLIALQALTRPLGQFVTGSCVNAVLVISCLVGGFWCGATTALISPFIAFLLGIGPAVILIVPAVAIGNICLVAIFALMHKKFDDKLLYNVLTVISAAILKFAVLFLLVSKIIIPIAALPAKQGTMITAMFSWPQLVTALIGGFVGAFISHRIKGIAGDLVKDNKNTGS